MVGSTWHCGARNCRITIDDLRAQLQSINRRPGPHVVPLCCCAMRPRASFVPKLGLYCSAKVLYASRVPPRSLGEINEPTLQLPVAVGLPVVLVSLARRRRGNWQLNCNCNWRWVDRCFPTLDRKSLVSVGAPAHCPSSSLQLPVGQFAGNAACTRAQQVPQGRPGPRSR